MYFTLELKFQSKDVKDVVQTKNVKNKRKIGKESKKLNKRGKKSLLTVILKERRKIDLPCQNLKI